ncbi:MAG: tRNA-binding protein [Pelagibacteraceae bacterium]|nr:tRNA-binding protein [Pelagibacteraceae bacterium]|tara:strand:+ start:128 stop:460 length:333 start_codon:yes stop_codon:yes gene_type:complete
MINFHDFEKVDIRVGTVINAELNKKSSKPSFKIIIDFGNEIGVKKTSAQLTENYKSEDLIGLQIAAVINFPPKQIGQMISEVLVLGFPDENNKAILVMPSKKVKNGGKLF